MKIKEMLEDSRPREKLKKKGVENLADSEILALIMRTGTNKENAIEMSTRLIKKYGLDKLSDCSLSELQEINGIGLAKACQILALFEFNKRHSQSKNPIKKITCAEDVYDYFKDDLENEKQENFYILILNNKNKIIKKEFITRGVLDASIIHPREIFRPAIKNSASKIILVHNHPSGDPKPSDEDLDVTKKIIKFGKEIDIKVLDHVIVGGENNKTNNDKSDKGWWSWVEDG